MEGEGEQQSKAEEAITRDGRAIILEKGKRPHKRYPRYNSSGVHVHPDVIGEVLDRKA